MWAPQYRFKFQARVGNVRRPTPLVGPGVERVDLEQPHEPKEAAHAPRPPLDPSGDHDRPRPVPRPLRRRPGRWRQRCHRARQFRRERRADRWQRQPLPSHFRGCALRRLPDFGSARRPGHQRQDRHLRHGPPDRFGHLRQHQHHGRFRGPRLVGRLPLRERSVARFHDDGDQSGAARWERDHGRLPQGPADRHAAAGQATPTSVPRRRTVRPTSDRSPTTGATSSS